MNLKKKNKQTQIDVAPNGHAWQHVPHMSGFGVEDRPVTREFGADTRVSSGGVKLPGDPGSSPRLSCFSPGTCASVIPGTTNPGAALSPPKGWSVSRFPG